MPTGGNNTLTWVYVYITLALRVPYFGSLMLPVSSVLSFSKRKKIEFLMKSHKRTPIKTGCYNCGIRAPVENTRAYGEWVLFVVCDDYA